MYQTSGGPKYCDRLFNENKDDLFNVEELNEEYDTEQYNDITNEQDENRLSDRSHSENNNNNKE